MDSLKRSALHDELTNRLVIKDKATNEDGSYTLTIGNSSKFWTRGGWSGNVYVLEDGKSYGSRASGQGGIHPLTDLYLLDKITSALVEYGDDVIHKLLYKFHDMESYIADRNEIRRIHDNRIR